MKNTKSNLIFTVLLACAFFITCNNPIMEKWWEKQPDNPAGPGTPATAAYHTVTFEANGGTPTPSSQYIAPGGKISKLQPMVRDHYGFGGWYTDRDCSPANEWDFGAAVTSSFTLYARWVPQYDILITFDTNCEALPPPHPQAPPEQRLIKDTLVVRPEPMADYPDTYGFDGWYTESECIHRWNFSLVAAESHTLYANWVQTYKTVTFVPNGGSLPYSEPPTYPEEQRVAPNSYAVSPLPMSREGYAFGGWYDNPAFTGDPWNFTEDPVANDLILYAKWEPYVFIITFEANGGLPQPESQTLSYGANAVRPLPMSLGGGYGFGGWYKDEDFTDEWDFATEVKEDLTLYAKWEPINYYFVTFIPNGGSPPPIMQYIYSGGKVIEPAPMSLLGRGFGGWYKDDGWIDEWDFATEVTEDLILYAKWDTIDYQVTFEANGGYPAPGTQNLIHGTRIVEPAPMNLDGYGFGGWYKDADFIEPWDFATEVTSPLTLYARWDTYKYTVLFETNGGKPEPINQVVMFDTLVTRPSAMTKTSANFGGWFRDPYFLNEWDFATDKASNYTIDGFLTLHAKWEALPEIYTVSFDPNGGTPVPLSQSIVTGAKAYEPEPMSRSSHGFGGWYKDALFNELWDFNKPVDESFTLYAKWETIYHLVTFEANGGNPEPISQSLIDGTPVVEPMAMSRRGYGFGGWYTGDDYKNEWNFDTPVDRDINLYAKWVDARFLVKFDLKRPPGSSGGNIDFAEEIDPGENVSVPPADLLPADGWSLYGWFYTDRADFNPAIELHRNALKDWDFDWTVALDEQGDLSVARDNGVKEKLVYGYDPKEEKLFFTLYARWVPDEPNMVWVQKGSFTMGAKGSGTSPERNVRFSTGFYIGMYEVTQKAYRGHKGYEEIMTESGLDGYSDSNTSTGSATPSHFKIGDIDGPVDRVSWYDALVFCNLRTMQENASNPGLNLKPVYWLYDETDPAKWLEESPRPISSPSDWDLVAMDSAANGYRLPTEAEWEYAARGGNGSPGNFTYAGTNIDPPLDHAWFGGSTASGNSNSMTHTVGTKEPNGLGIYDMSGNLMEWCWDWYGSTYYSGRPNPDYDPTGPSSGTERVRRGGSWNNAATNLRNVVRNSFPPNNDTWVMGFRIVRGPSVIY